MYTLDFFNLRQEKGKLKIVKIVIIALNFCLKKKFFIRF